MNSEKRREQLQTKEREIERKQSKQGNKKERKDTEITKEKKKHEC